MNKKYFIQVLIIIAFVNLAALASELFADENEGLDKIEKKARAIIIREVLRQQFGAEHTSSTIFIDGTDLERNSLPEVQKNKFVLLAPRKREKFDRNKKAYWRFWVVEMSDKHLELCLANGTDCTFSGDIFEFRKKGHDWTIFKDTNQKVGCGSGCGSFGSAHPALPPNKAVQPTETR